MYSTLPRPIDNYPSLLATDRNDSRPAAPRLQLTFQLSLDMSCIPEVAPQRPVLGS